jgi:hypothetical protein
MQHQTEASTITSLAGLWQVPLVRIVWMSNGHGGRNYFFILEDGRQIGCTASELMNQRRFQTEMVSIGVMPLDVPPKKWREVVWQIVQAAEPSETKGK